MSAQPAQPAQPAQATAPVPFGTHTSGSLYVGDLLPEVTEALLFEIFNQVGPVSSIRVCRDAATRRSLGYAYVNFHNVVDAERALDTLNFTPIKGRQCRIMWSQRNPALRKNFQSNIFIKNLDKSIDNKALYDHFSSFGNILSCKVSVDTNNISKGYGFVHFEAEDSAQKAIEHFDGNNLSGKKLSVARFAPRSERGGTLSVFTNVYVKNIPLEWDEKKLADAFEKFGNITSLSLPKDAEGKYRGFGFVNFETHEQASAAIEKASSISIGGDKFLYAGRFQSKNERKAILAKQYAEFVRSKSEKYKGHNLYVKNFDEDVDDAKLREMFAPFGEITSAIVMLDQRGISKGFGFVCFSAQEACTKALAEMNNKMVGKKPLYVNLAQPREERKHYLETQYQTMVGRIPPLAPIFYGPPMQPGLMYPQPMIPRRYPTQPQPRPYSVYPHQGPKPRGRGQHRAPMQTGQRPMPQKRYPHNMAVTGPSVVIPPQQEFSTMLASANNNETRKQILGERLFPLVHREQPELAGKITGMLLEMEVSETLALLESPHELRTKISEAIDVLRSNPDPQA